MKKCIAILAVALFVVSIGPGFAQQPQTSTTDRPALEDKRFPTTDPAQNADRPGAMSPEVQKKSGSDYPMGDQNRPDTKPVKKSNKSTKSQTQTPARDKTTGSPVADGQYMPPGPERK